MDLALEAIFFVILYFTSSKHTNALDFSCDCIDTKDVSIDTPVNKVVANLRSLAKCSQNGCNPVIKRLLVRKRSGKGDIKDFQSEAIFPCTKIQGNDARKHFCQGPNKTLQLSSKLTPKLLSNVFEYYVGTMDSPNISCILHLMIVNVMPTGRLKPTPDTKGSCSMVETIDPRAVDGTKVANLQNFSPCRSRCRKFSMRSLKVKFVDSTTRQFSRRSIKECTQISSAGNALEQSFCFEKSDNTMEVTSKLRQNNLAGSTFTYKITVEWSGDDDDYYAQNEGEKHKRSIQDDDDNRKDCSLEIRISVPPTTSPSTTATTVTTATTSRSATITTAPKTTAATTNLKSTITATTEELTTPFTSSKAPSTAKPDMVSSKAKEKPRSDVASMQWDIRLTKIVASRLMNKTHITGEEFENVTKIKLKDNFERKQLNIANLDLYPTKTNIDGREEILTVKALYRQANESERLRICKIVLRRSPSRKFNATSLDCCAATTTGQNSSTGEIYWPVTLIGNTAQRNCPFSYKSNRAFAYRKCGTDSKKFPFWKKPEVKNCRGVSEMTRKLNKLAKRKMSKGNMKNTMKELRQLTKRAKDFKDRYDMEFSTEVLENAMKIPDEHDQMADDILGTASDLMNANESLVLEGQQMSNTSTRLLLLMEKLSDDMKVGKMMKNQQENLAMGINIFDTKTIENGLNIHGFVNKSTGLAELNFNNNTSNIDPMAYVFLSPTSLRKINKGGNWKQKKITSFLFTKSVLFQTANQNSTGPNNLKVVDSKVISISVNGRRVQNLNGDEEIQNYFKPKSRLKNASYSCVYWDFKAKNGTGDWSSKGCTAKGLHNNNNMFQCSCNHMTNFAILLDVIRRPLSQSETKALSIVTYIGCTISFLGLFITIVTYSAFRKLRQTLPNRILLCLSFSLMMTMVIFLGGGLVQSTIACETIAVLLHYFVLASFCWMVVEAFNIYRSFVIVFRPAASKFMIKANIFAWGVPLIIVLTTTLVSRLEDYSSSTRGNWICVVGGLPFYLAYLSPISLILLANFIVLLTTMLALGRKSGMAAGKTMTGKSKAKIGVIFSILLGCTWLFGLIAVEDLKFTFQLLFCIFNSLQGFFIFVFFCARNEDVRKEWSNVFKRNMKDGKINKKLTRYSSNNQTTSINLEQSRSESQRSLAKCLDSTM